MSDGHGNTPAAWAAVVIGLIGFVVGGVGLVFSPINMTLFWAGIAIIVAAGVAFVVMDKIGMHSEH